MRHPNLDKLLKDWSFDPHSLSVRLIKGDDGRDVVQMRVDMGVLQMETRGRPDGSQPSGFPTYLAYLLDAQTKTPDMVLDEEQCFEVDREFVQYYHRRISWLRLQYYRRACADADHTLALMDFCKEHSPDDEWTMNHEQYRPFVLFHRTQAAALAALEESNAEDAVTEINEGLEKIRTVFVEHEVEDEFEDDELVGRLTQLRESLREEYAIGKTLQERLREAVDKEQYELAARIREELAKRHGA